MLLHGIPHAHGIDIGTPDRVCISGYNDYQTEKAYNIRLDSF